MLPTPYPEGIQTEAWQDCWVCSLAAIEFWDTEWPCEDKLLAKKSELSVSCQKWSFAMAGFLYIVIGGVIYQIELMRMNIFKLLWDFTLVTDVCRETKQVHRLED